MPDLNTDALTSVDNARLFIHKATRDATDNDLLTILINTYSRAIRLYTGRQFLPMESGVSRDFRYEGSGFLSLQPFELRNLSSIVLNTDLPQTSWVTLAVQSPSIESQYRLEPRRRTIEGTFLWISLPEIGPYSPLVPEPIIPRRARGHQVTITGDWGAGVVPADVEAACLIAVARGFRNPEGFATRTIGGLSFAEHVEPSMIDDIGMSLPKDSRALLAPYRRLAWG